MGEPQRAAYGEQATYGQFVEAMGKTELENGQHMIDSLRKLDTEGWRELREMPLTRELVIGFAEGIAIIYYSMIASINSVKEEKAYLAMIDEGHAFLSEIYEKAIKLGVEVDLSDIDTPLTIHEYLAERGYVKHIQ